MEFLEAVGKRRSIRWFKTWESVPQEKIQRILEVVRLTTCPGNLQPWRAVVVERDKLDAATRDRLLADDNWQGAHTQAPLWIYWYGDLNAARPESFASKTKDLIDFGALPTTFGWSKQMIDNAIDKGEQVPEGMPAINELLHGLPVEASANIAYAETVGACAVATLAAINEGLGTCLHMIAAPSKQDDVKKLLGVPDSFVPVWLQLVGYPAEDPDAGGVRPRMPYEEIYSFMKWGHPYQRNLHVVEQLEAEGLPQPTDQPKANRFDELKYLARMFGYPV
jgi:nitroreductase